MVARAAAGCRSHGGTSVTFLFIFLPSRLLMWNSRWCAALKPTRQRLSRRPSRQIDDGHQRSKMRLDWRMRRRCREGAQSSHEWRENTLGVRHISTARSPRGHHAHHVTEMAILKIFLFFIYFYFFATAPSFFVSFCA